MIDFKRHKILCIITILVLILSLIAVMLLLPPYNSQDLSNWTKLDFDVKLIRLNTEIQVHKNNTKIGYVSGNILRLITDPLTYYDVNGETLAYADDSYHFIAQDSHVIKVNDEVIAEMVGKVKFLGESYDIYNDKGVLMAKAEFDYINLNGKITNVNGDKIAIYRANPVMKDFTLYVSPNSIIDEKTLIMICASYYSDYAADSKNNSNNSSN